MYRIGILSDIHYASAAEQARGNDYELRGIRNPALRAVMRWFRHFIVCGILCIRVICSIVSWSVPAC